MCILDSQFNVMKADCKRWFNRPLTDVILPEGTAGISCIVSPAKESRPDTTSELYSSTRLPKSVFTSSTLKMEPHVADVRISLDVVLESCCVPFTSCSKVQRKITNIN